MRNGPPPPPPPQTSGPRPTSPPPPPITEAGFRSMEAYSKARQPAESEPVDGGLPWWLLLFLL